MTKTMDQSDIMERTGDQPNDRRRFMRLCGGAAAMTGGLALLSACGDDNDDGGTGSTPTPTPSSSSAVGTQDTDILNFALQLEYLAANYFAFATTGAGIASGLTTGLGTQGTVLVGTGDGAVKAVTFPTDSIVRQYALEMAADATAHITFLRTALGSLAQAQPRLNLSGSATVARPNTLDTYVGAFTLAARRAKIITDSQTFDPYANETNFLIGAWLITGIAVSAFRGAARRISNKTYLEAAAGMLGTYSYHAATVRAELWARGRSSSGIYDQIKALSDYLDTIDGSTDADQDIGTATTANLVPTDANGGVLGRTPFQVLNVVYLNAGWTSEGGFYPSGMNGAFRTTNS